METMVVFFYKILGLIKHLVVLYSGTLFKLDTIEVANTLNESVVFFINTKTKAHLSKSLEDIFNNKNLLKHFDSEDACQIGYTYGRLITIDKLTNKNSVNNADNI